MNSRDNGLSRSLAWAPVVALRRAQLRHSRVPSCSRSWRTRRLASSISSTSASSTSCHSLSLEGAVAWGVIPTGSRSRMAEMVWATTRPRWAMHRRRNSSQPWASTLLRACRRCSFRAVWVASKRASRQAGRCVETAWHRASVTTERACICMCNPLHPVLLLLAPHHYRPRPGFAQACPSPGLQ